jgi:hypothetical protein
MSIVRCCMCEEHVDMDYEDVGICEFGHVCSSCMIDLETEEAELDPEPESPQGS